MVYLYTHKESQGWCFLQRAYSQRLVITVSRSTQKILLLAQGQGEEPQLEFSSPELQLGPVLPYAEGAMADVIVRNPCSFPIEFYSLDFDKQYLEEEEVSLMASHWVLVKYSVVYSVAHFLLSVVLIRSCGWWKDMMPRTCCFFLLVLPARLCPRSCWTSTKSVAHKTPSRVLYSAADDLCYIRNILPQH